MGVGAGSGPEVGAGVGVGTDDGSRDVVEVAVSGGRVGVAVGVTVAGGVAVAVGEGAEAGVAVGVGDGVAIGVGSGSPQAARISSPEITTGRQNRGDAMRQFYITRFTLPGQIRSRPHFSQTRNTTGETGRNSVPMRDSSAG